MDNKPLEKEALDFVTSRVSKFGYKYSLPNYDTNGGDFFMVEEFSPGLCKILKCQSKGRDIRTHPSNVRIPSSYVNEQFMLFVYLKTDDLDNDYLYLFTYDDIKKWGKNSNDEYVLYIGKKFHFDITNQKSLFNSKKLYLLDEALLNIVEPYAINVLRNLDILHLQYELWKMTGALPDIKLLLHAIEEPELLGLDVLVFLLCNMVLQKPYDLNYNIDWGFWFLKEYKNNIITFPTREVSERVLAFSAVTYNNTWVQHVEYDENRESVQGYHLHIADDEEYIDVFLFRNGAICLNHDYKLKINGTS